jgi:hypothetical protein
MMTFHKRAAIALAGAAAVWSAPYETTALPTGPIYSAFIPKSDGIFINLKSAPDVPGADILIDLSCVDDASTFFRRLTELRAYTGDETMELPTIGDESVAYGGYKGYEVWWRRGDVIGRTSFHDVVTPDMAVAILGAIDMLLPKP